MTKFVNVHEAKTHLSRLLEDVSNGEDVVIAKSGVPCARLTSVASGPRPSGMLKGVWPDIDLGNRFFDALPDAELGAWEQ
jgi:prevent-host-death family protein